MNLYLGLNLLVVALPVALSFDRKVAFYRRWPAVLLSSTVVAVVYLLWDVWATWKGHWWFSREHVGDFRLFGLPAGEILFFFAVPFSCLFLFEVVGAYWGDRKLKVPRAVWIALAALFAGLAVAFRGQGYTMAVLSSVAAFFAAASLTPVLGRRQFWLYLLLSGVGFLVVNGVLTALPVVSYGEEAIWGLRLYTIPLEDFFYCLSLLGFNGLVYSVLRRPMSLGKSESAA
jgi:lycopene cyclase domain-containing protein